MNNEKSKTNIPPIPDGVRYVHVKLFNNETNKFHLIESLDLYREIKGSPFNSWKEDEDGEV
tara:strand:- start:321 stop:503 length:183 start_codon:yes stop_codon:yes gene_type:complete